MPLVFLSDWIRELRSRKVMVKKSVSDFDNITTVVDDYDLQILEMGFEKLQRRFARGATKYPKHVLYDALLEGNLWEKYSGLTKEQSKKINEILVNAVLEGKYTKPELVAERIVRAVGIPKRRALLIARTELAYIANKARELAYKKLTKVQKFVWITEKDGKVCDKCKRMAELTQHGVTLDEIKRLVKQVCGDSARELLCHPGCRCSIYRYYDDKRYVKWWEKADIPPERRIYIKPDKVAKYKQMGLTVYRGKRGGYYIDKLEAKEKGIDTEKLERRQKKFSGRHMQKLVARLEELGLKDEVLSSLEKLLSGDEDKAVEGYYELRGLLRKYFSENGIPVKDRLEYYGRLRLFMWHRYGIDPAKRKKGQVEDANEDVVDKLVKMFSPSNENAMDLYLKFTNFIDDEVPIKLMDRFYKVSGVLREIYREDDSLDNLKRKLENELALLYIDVNKYSDEIEREQIKAKLSELFGFDFESLRGLLSNLYTIDVEKLSDLANELERIAYEFDYEGIADYFGDLSYMLKGFMNGYDGALYNGKVYVTSAGLEKIKRKLREDSVRRILKGLSMELIMDRFFDDSEVLNEISEAFEKLNAVSKALFGKKIPRSVLRDVRKKAREYIAFKRKFNRYYKKGRISMKDVQSFRIPVESFSKLKDLIEKHSEMIDDTNRSIQSLQAVMALEFFNKYYLGGGVKDYVFGMAILFKELGFDDRIAVSLAKGWEVARTWTMVDFKKYTGHIERIVHKIRGNSRPLRSVHEIRDDEFKELFNNTSPEEVYLYKKFSEEFVKMYYGSDTIEVYRGVSHWEIVQMFADIYSGESRMDNLRVKATLVSTSLSLDTAGKFAEQGVKIKVNVPTEYVWGGWWNASPDYIDEQEIIVEFPNKDDERFRVSLYDAPKYVRNVLWAVEDLERFRSATTDKKRAVFMSVFGSGLSWLTDSISRSYEMIGDKKVVDDTVRKIGKMLNDVTDVLLESLGPEYFRMHEDDIRDTLFHIKLSDLDRLPEFAQLIEKVNKVLEEE